MGKLLTVTEDYARRDVGLLSAIARLDDASNVSSLIL